MGTKTDQLNKLFLEWEKEIEEYQGHFIKDGINNEEKFQATKPKILFITKEPNNPKKDEGDFREWWRNELRYTFSNRIAEWSYGIFKEFPPYDKIKNEKQKKLDAMHSIAFMNLKKSGGKGSADNNEISRHVELNQTFIRKEIKIISPEIIILGVSTKSLRTQIFPELEDKWNNSGYDVAISKLSEIKVIDFYHPSSRNGAAASYSLLQNVYNSDAYESL